MIIAIAETELKDFAIAMSMQSFSSVANCYSYGDIYNNNLVPFIRVLSHHYTLFLPLCT